ncbi:MAG TPA: hypothetical protein ENJ77_00430 [Candidatus Moranbacteria bacterium]|nr:hypothetical protein [Candidatus Moranbacteria bacterium]
MLVALVSFGAGPLVWLLLSLWVVFLYLYILVLRGYSVSFIAFFIALGVVLTLIFSSVFD